MDSQTSFDTRTVGALPAIVDYLGRLDLAATIDRIVPWNGDVPLGTLVEVMVANRLLQPRALFRIGQWSEAAAVTDYFGLTADQLNDDRLGRALERIAEHAPTIQSALVLKAIDHFDLDVSQIHYNLTTVELYGTYDVDLVEGQPHTASKPAYGRTKSGRRHLKQVQLGLEVTGDGGLPVGHLPLDGNAAEVNIHMEKQAADLQSEGGG
jgi:transposase